MRLLLVEDDAALAHAAELMLKIEGFHVFTSDTGEEAIGLAKAYAFDAMLLDLGLPDISGMDVLRGVRAAKLSLPVIVLTGRVDIETKVKAFSLGADDFLTKPFHREELVSRLHALIRRSKGLPTSIVEIGSLRLDLGRKVLSGPDGDIYLTSREYAFLEVLASRRGSVVTPEALMNHVYGGLDEPDDKIVDVYICKLRKKLKPSGLTPVIACHWGRGYSLPSATTPHPDLASATTGAASQEIV